MNRDSALQIKRCFETNDWRWTNRDGQHVEPYRVSVTELDSYRYFKDSEDANLDDLLAQFRHETPPTEAMAAGTAWHKALEQWDWGTDEADDVNQDGWHFQIAGDIELRLPMVAELKGEMVLDTPCGPVTLVGKVDGLTPTGVIDYKLSQRFDAERYVDALQWRCYLLMFEQQQFTYGVFECSDPSRSSDVTIRDYHEMAFYAYPGLQADVQRAVDEFAAFVTKYLPERVRPDLVAA